MKINTNLLRSLLRESFAVVSRITTTTEMREEKKRILCFPLACVKLSLSSRRRRTATTRACVGINSLKNRRSSRRQALFADKLHDSEGALRVRPGSFFWPAPARAKKRDTVSAPVYYQTCTGGQHTQSTNVLHRQSPFRAKITS